MNTYIISVAVKRTEEYTIHADSLEEAKIMALESDRFVRPNTEGQEYDVHCVRFIPGNVKIA